MESVAKSTLLVASSITTMLLRRKSARAMAINCLCPCEKLVPPADTCVLKESFVLVVSTVVEAVSEVSSPWIDAALEADGDVRREVDSDSRSVWVMRFTRRRTSRHASSSKSPAIMSERLASYGRPRPTEWIQIVPQSPRKEGSILRICTSDNEDGNHQTRTQI
ncbi:hypothetical protein FB45DRAFT_871699 [Roridomyces roridus]|uniref:Uncharacterized protein n=1 Tax=Roridomyces roridus TaxID=1738132 RepID=A0AAD7BFQ0_9AGAR|nr:hypothetical protein FB45DRAFT_871699 [Roridomyces roridus]